MSDECTKCLTKYMTKYGPGAGDSDTDHYRVGWREPTNVSIGLVAKRFVNLSIVINRPNERVRCLFRVHPRV
jgi:hypothetical protein